MSEIEYQDADNHVQVIDHRGGVNHKYWLPKAKLALPPSIIKTRMVIALGCAVTKVPPGVNAPVRSITQLQEHPMPGLVRRAGNFARAAVNHAKNGATASTEVIQQRWEKCNLCESLVRTDQHSGKCSKVECGCYLADDERVPNKLAWAEQECPLGEWEAVNG